MASLPPTLLLFLLVFGVFTPALNAYFEADDFLWVIHRDWSDGWHALTGSWGLGTAYRPITRLSFLLDARLFGWNALPWHAVNLALHALNATLLAKLVGESGASRRDALLAGAVFAVLPLDWENVDWISGRTGLLCLGFMLAAAIFWRRTQHRWWHVVPACLCQALALLCYEPALVLPAALLVLVPVSGRTPAARRRLALAAATLAGSAALVWLLRAMLLGTAGLATDVAGAHYPVTLGHDMLSLGAHGLRDFGAVGLAGLAAMLAAGLADTRHRAVLAALLACCGVLYLPFTPVYGFTERFAYLATAPLAVALVVASMSWRRGRAVLCLLAVAFALRSHAQAGGFAHAGTITRAMLARIAAIPADGRNLVFDNVPTHDGPYYLLWANFEDAVAARRPAPGFAATSEWVLRMPDLRRRALREATLFLRYEPSSGRFVELSRAAWLGLHGVPPG
jgi:hypothetical protein